MAIAYFINQYPKVSHSFIRREILALEELGIPIQRFSIRACEDELVDPADQDERLKTTVLLQTGVKGLVAPLLKRAIAHPFKFLGALRLALRLGKRSQRGLLYDLVYLAEACALYQYCQASGVTHIHAHFGTNSTTITLLCQALGGPSYSFTVHGPEEFDKPEALSLTEKIEHAAFVVGISSFGRSQLFRWCRPEQWPKVQVVHCGVDDRFLDLAPTPVPDVPQFVCVARLGEQKGHFLLVEAVQQLAAEGLHFKVVLVGDGPLRADLERAIAQANLQSYFEITGWASGDTVQQHILQSRAMILPSFAEGLPVVIMEALALGRPVISTYVAGIPELVEPGTCGWLVSAGAAAPLAEAIRAALHAAPATLTQMGQAGRSRVLQNHNIHTEASHLAALFTHAQNPTAATIASSAVLPSHSSTVPSL